MSRLDSTASGALDGDTILPVFFAYLDVDGDPVRVNTSGHTITLSGTGDADLDGFTFDGISPTVAEVGPVRQKAGGSDRVTAKLSGIVGLDDDLLAAIGDQANWKGRPARLWQAIRDASGTQQGAIRHYYTGYMVNLRIGLSPSEQFIIVEIEGYLAAFSQASNRNYLDQDAFDPGDLSAKAAMAIANGNSGNPLTNNTPVSPNPHDRRGPWGLPLDGMLR